MVPFRCRQGIAGVRVQRIDKLRRRHRGWERRGESGALDKIYRQNSNPKYISFATALTVQGLILSRLGRNDEAEKDLREAVKLREENLPNKHFMTALTKGALGECLTVQKRYDEAETLLVASHVSLAESQGPNNPRTLLAQRRLVNLYQRWNKPELAEKYRLGSR